MHTPWLIAACLLSVALGSSPTADWGPSSPRKSINFGPDNPARSSSLSSNSASAILLNLYNQQYAPSPFAVTDQDRTVFGEVLATAFLKEHQPAGTTFKVTDSYVSAHSGIAHVYYVQTASLGAEVGVAPVSNAVASVHVDVDTSSPRFGHILSYSESFHPLQETLEPVSPTNYHHLAALRSEKARKIDEWRAGCQSLKASVSEVLSSSAFSKSAVGQEILDLSGAGVSSDAVARLGVCETGPPPVHLTTEVETHRASTVVDPRVALVSFLTLVADPKTATSLLGGGKSLEELVESMYIRQPFHSSGDGMSHRVEVMNVPGVARLDHADVPTKAELAYLSVPAQDGDEHSARELQLVWRFEYRSDANWYEGYVDATRPGLIASSIDWVKDFRPTTEDSQLTAREHFDTLRRLSSTACGEGSICAASSMSRKVKPGRPAAPEGPASYRVFQWGVNDPSEGERDLLVDPAHPVASRVGWHSIPPAQSYPSLASEDWINVPGWSSRTSLGMNTTDTRGNNVFAQENWEGLSRWENNGRADGGETLVFDFKLGWGPKENRTGRHIDPKGYIDAAVTELFYTCNEIHDLFYMYGFDEASGNFQEYNFGRGGRQGDAVIANAQDGSGYKWAFTIFVVQAPPDGNHGQMRMYVWNGAEPWRDGDLEAGIVIHEYSHGLSNRLTGGPANSGCLGWGEAGGMGEGWGDTFATIVRMHKKKPQDFSMGEWASGRKGGIRKYKYSLNHTTNIETYKTLDGPGYWGVHAIGEVWAEMLYTVAEALIAKHGFSDDLFPTSTTDPEFYTASAKTLKKHPRKGNTLFVQLVIDGMKLQPCRPSFISARDAILQADEMLTGGDNACDIWRAFASRGLGVDAKLIGATPWGGGVREEDFSTPQKCGHKTPDA